VGTIQYLGALLSDNPRLHAIPVLVHADGRFFALQGAGLSRHRTDPDTIRYLLMSVLRPVLTYDTSCLHTSQNAMHVLEKYQTKLIKAALSPKTPLRNTPML